jgi:cellulase
LKGRVADERWTDQLTVTGGGSASPATVKFPGAYKASDPGIKVNIHAAVSSYVVPGPAVYAGGTTKVAGVGASCANKGSKMVLRGTNDVWLWDY